MRTNIVIDEVTDVTVPVIIDTTVWIDFFRNAKTEQTDLFEKVVRRGETPPLAI